MCMKTGYLNFSVLAALVACLPTLTSAAGVESISLETFKDGDERTWEVNVKCNSEVEPRIMRRAVGSDEWCSADIVNMCDKNKFSLSQQLCDDNFAQRLVNSQNSDSSQSNSVERLGEQTSEQASTLLAGQGLAKSDSTAEPVSRSDLIKEQMQIEEQRILIEQKRLELRRQELSLQRQQLEKDN